MTGSFGGSLNPDGCNRPMNYGISGQIGGGRITGKAMRGADFNWRIGSDGRFGGEMLLRRQSRNNIVQAYQGRIDGDRVIIDAFYGVKGVSLGSCTAHGVFQIR